ncbi:hypothetical protein [Mycobacterium sp. CnD-18-1]|uniref:hypothetical protein n=1 Tax=Mycobacterium sp. CnD-18-1 TaxID=2917744 RepID=UPI001EF38C8F|nr:hypothetical protein [Mycobacterium sp. CnD-18-1]MCG7610364.1 hypothetical protein [Mycobacterium sp. CnD-18-1]
MTRQLPKPVAVPLGWVIFGAINGFIYGAGWALMRYDDLTDAITSRRAARQLWREADQITQESAR